MSPAENHGGDANVTVRTRQELAAVIDHTLLNPSAVAADIRRHCCEAVEHRFAAVCVNPRWMSLAADIVRGSAVKVAGVVGFGFGAETTTIKAAQARDVVFNGADEVDMLADLAAIREGDRNYFVREMRAVLTVCRSVRPPVVLKVIIESAALTDEQIIFACRAAQDVGVDFIKTSTGLHPAGGARVEHVRLMAATAPRCRIKAAGGIRTAADAIAMLEAGASRIGASASVEILRTFSPPGT